jgi:hypothetical protein
LIKQPFVYIPTYTEVHIEKKLIKRI